MKKVLASLVAVGLMATAANAATIGLQWAEAPGSQNLAASGGTIQVYLNVLGGEQISGVVFDYSTLAENLTVTGQTANVPGWGQSGVAGPLNGRQFGGFANTAADLIDAAGSYIVGTTVITVEGPADLTTKNITALVPQNAVGVVNQLGQRLTWDARYNATFAGYIAFGNWGNPGWGTKPASGHQPTANPLQITKTPEPTSLALVALGGFALLRRRR